MYFLEIFLIYFKFLKKYIFHLFGYIFFHLFLIMNARTSTIIFTHFY